MTSILPQQDVMEPELDEIDAAIAFHGGDLRATIACLLEDCADLRRNLALTERAMSLGITRGWRPSFERD